MRGIHTVRFAVAGVLSSALVFACASPSSGDESADSSDDSSGNEGGSDGGESGTETGGNDGAQGVDFEEGMPELLSELNLMSWDGSVITYEPNVYFYELNVPLFTDFALKSRAIYVPEGEHFDYVDNEVLEFPVGTVILKSFMFPADFREPAENIDLIETRLLVRWPDEWKVYPYIWDHELGDAVLTVQGEVREVDFIDAEGIERTSTYLIPQKNQCRECHEIKDDQDETHMTPIGPKARHMNRDGLDVDNQLTAWAEAGLLEGLPDLGEVGQSWDQRDLEDTAIADMSYEEVNRATRDYLDINCAYCHNPRGVNGISSQLFLNYDNEDDFHLGVCKKPGSAGEGAGGLTYDIVPGNADESILVYRSETLDVGAMMPLIGRSLTHDEGIVLLRRWIDEMPPNDCEVDPPMP
jgi:uncharacterized repeat protein (TIGR03806 family)